jgi:hypothetical protein
MSEQETYCFYCECLRAKDAGATHIAVIEMQHTHGGEQVYIVQITIGGDSQQCTKFADMMRAYAKEALGNNIVVDLTPKATGKPN